MVTLCCLVVLHAGFSVSNDQWLIAADYIKNWSEFSNFGASDNLDNSSRYALGLQFTPDRKAINKYFKMVRYRFGAYSANTYLNLRGQALTRKSFFVWFWITNEAQRRFVKHFCRIRSKRNNTREFNTRFFCSI